MKTFFNFLILFTFYTTILFSAITKTNISVIKYKKFYLLFNQPLFMEDFRKTPPSKKKYTLGKVKSPIKSYKKIEKKKKLPLTEDVKLYKTAEELFNTENFKEAEQTLLTLLQKFPATPVKDKSIFLLARIKVKQKNYKEAEVYLRKIIEEFPGSKIIPETYFTLGRIYFLQNSFSSAIETLITLLNLYPNSSYKLKAYILLGDIYKQRKNYEKAIEYYLKAKDMPEGLFKLGEIYEKIPEIRNFEKAVKYYKEIIEKHPDSKYFLPAQKRIDYINKNFLDFE